ncbi:MAG: ATP-binding cassette domain-containing protein [Acidobacteriota bacterium]|nr:ATP-binding cassette domain-containing protein [Acidobacteriota bacterium]
MLEVALRQHLGARRIDVRFALRQPWTILFGPSGSGKTTVLRAIAGVLRPESGRIVSRTGQPAIERTLLDTAGGVCLPPHLRPLRGAAQTPWLFPGRTVAENVRYGMGWRSHPADEAELCQDVLRLFRLSTLATRRPQELSGGERQRTSVARAVAAAVSYDGPERALLLLDEPFNGLDGVLRDELALELRAWLAGWKVPVLSVSHDVVECYRLEAEVIRMAEGEVLDQGPAASVLARERERILARLEAAELDAGDDDELN